MGPFCAKLCKRSADCGIELAEAIAKNGPAADKQALEKAKADLSPKRWNELARDESVDKTTSMRGGNLGFVAPDGSTTDPNLKVDPALYAAAEKVKDSELVVIKPEEEW